MESYGKWHRLPIAVGLINQWLTSGSLLGKEGERVTLAWHCIIHVKHWHHISAIRWFIDVKININMFNEVFSGNMFECGRIVLLHLITQIPVIFSSGWQAPHHLITGIVKGPFPSFGCSTLCNNKSSAHDRATDWITSFASQVQDNNLHNKLMIKNSPD